MGFHEGCGAPWRGILAAWVTSGRSLGLWAWATLVAVMCLRVSDDSLPRASAVMLMMSLIHLALAGLTALLLQKNVTLVTATSSLLAFVIIASVASLT